MGAELGGAHIRFSEIKRGMVLGGHMNIKNIILRTTLTLFATLFGISYGSGIFCMYTEFLGPQHPNPDEQNMLLGYF